MKFLNYKYVIACVLVIITCCFSGCTDDFEAINTNPNDPEVVNPSVLLPNVLRESVKRVHGHTTRLQRLGLDGGMLWVQYFARNQYTNEGDTYFTVADLMNANWKGFFNESLINAQQIIDIAGEEGGLNENQNYVAIGMIIKAWIFSVVTDTWGAVPYTEALDTEIITPVYDSQELIYTGLLASLKTASDLLDPNGPDISGDVLYQGDILKWKKLANSLRLRLANRQAAKKPAESAAIFSEILGNTTAYPIFESNDEHAALVHEARPSNNPWHEIMVFSGREDWSISQTLISAMTDGAGHPIDPRITVYANPATGGEMAGLYTGAINGLPEADASVFINGASRPGNFFLQETAPVVIMSYSELLFILAEAVLDGDYTGGLSAKEYLDLAVTASFDQYGLTSPDGYIDALNADKPTIMLEKWKALFAQGVEAWTEFRRTGFPVLTPPGPNTIFENGGQVPARLEYPNSEYSLNGTNVLAGVSINGGADNKTTELWWAE